MSVLSYFSNLQVILSYLKSDLIKKQKSFKIGLFTIFLVVFFVSLLLNAIGMSPLVFLRLSEDQAGEADIIMTPFLSKRDVSTLSSNFDSNLFGEKKVDNRTLTIPK